MSSEGTKKRPSARRERRVVEPRASTESALERSGVIERRAARSEDERAPKKTERKVSARRHAKPSAEPKPSAPAADGAKRVSARRRASEPRASELAPANGAKPVVHPLEDPSGAPDPLHELEETVDRLISEADSIAGDPHARRRAAEALSELAARLGGFEGETQESADAGLIDSARNLLNADYYVRQWGRLAMRNRSEQVDDFGLDRTYESRVAPLFEALYRRWFRVTVRGAAHVPAQGRGMIVANHGGALPWDGLVVRTALRLEHPAKREARWLTEDFVYHMPFLGAFLARVGAVRACPENAERLLDQDEVLTVFPEGIKGIGKLYRERYRLQRFGRGGYVKLALRTGTPIVPTGIVGSEETYPLLLQSTRLAKLAGVPFLPVTPTFPWLGPLGLVPLPSRWVIAFGEPLDLSSHGPDAADDALLVNRINDEVRARVQELVDGALGSRDAAYL